MRESRHTWCRSGGWSSQEAQALAEGITRIACHYNLVHQDVPPSAAFEAAVSGE